MSPARSRSLRNLALALVAVALAAWGQRLLASGHLRDGLIVYAVAGVVFVAVLRHRGGILTFSREPAWDGIFESKEEVGEKSPKLPQWSRWVALAVLAVSGGLAFAGLHLFSDQANLPTAWRLHLASIGFFLLAIYLFTAQSLKLSAFHPSSLSTSHLFALVLILLLAAFLRFYQLDTLPYGVWYDEADNGLQVRRMLEDPAWRPVYVPSTNLPAHFLYLVLFSFRVLGQTPLALRVVAAALGLLTVPAAYLVGRELFPGDRRLGLVLAFFLAVSRWDVNWSRIGMHGTSVPLFELCNTNASND